jgi:hypothetical protein
MPSDTLDVAEVRSRIRSDVHSRLIDSVDRPVGRGRSPWSPPPATGTRGCLMRPAGFGLGSEHLLVLEELAEERSRLI